MGGREWDHREGGSEVRNPGDEVEALVRGVIGSLRSHHLLDSRSKARKGPRVVVEARS